MGQYSVKLLADSRSLMMIFGIVYQGVLFQPLFLKLIQFVYRICFHLPTQDELNVESDPRFGKVKVNYLSDHKIQKHLNLQHMKERADEMGTTPNGGSRVTWGLFQRGDNNLYVMNNEDSNKGKRLQETTKNTSILALVSSTGAWQRLQFVGTNT